MECYEKDILDKFKDGDISKKQVMEYLNRISCFHFKDRMFQDDKLRVVVFKGNELVSCLDYKDNLTFSLTLDTQVSNVECHGNLICKDIKENVYCHGDLSCNNIEKNVLSCKNVKVGDVGGNIVCSGNVRCNNVSGNVTCDNNAFVNKINGVANVSNNLYSEVIVGNVDCTGEVYYSNNFTKNFDKD